MPEDPMAEEVTVETSDEEPADDAGEEFAEGGDGFVEDESGPEDADGSDDEGSDDEGSDDDEDEDEDGARPAGAGEEDDEDEPDPDEVEADLNEILRDRIAADEEEEDEEDEVDAPAQVPTGGTVQRQDTELHCPHCFLLIQAKTVAETGECGHCGGPIR